MKWKVFRVMGQLHSPPSDYLEFPSHRHLTTCDLPVDPAPPASASSSHPLCHPPPLRSPMTTPSCMLQSNSISLLTKNRPSIASRVSSASKIEGLETTLGWAHYRAKNKTLSMVFRDFESHIFLSITSSTHFFYFMTTTRGQIQ